MYDYRVTDVIRVIDGDTVDLRIDIGFHLSAALRFRLRSIDTPERGAERWADAKTFAEQWFAAKMGIEEVRAMTSKGDSFGRWLAHVYTRAGSLNEALLTAGLAVPYLRR